MPRAGTASTALWGALAVVLLLLYVSPLLAASSNNNAVNSRLKWDFQQPAHHDSQHRRGVAAAAIPDERRGPGHSDPVKAAPHEPLAFEALTEPSSRSSFLASREVHHEFGLSKRDALRCDDGPCIDGSCCSKDKICGFGPDYCGNGCRSNCTASAMCGEYSENGEMPCGMKLCCSAMGWCGVSGFVAPFQATP